MELTKQWLTQHGILVNKLNNNSYEVFHYGKKLKIGKQRRNKYDNVYYQRVAWSEGPFGNNHAITITLHRLVYAWFVEPIPEDYVIHHIDGDTLNNSLDNLQLLTKEEHSKTIKRRAYVNKHSE